MKPASRRLVLVSAAIGAFAGQSSFCLAGLGTDSRHHPSSLDETALERPTHERWSFSFESAYTFCVVPNPWAPLWGLEYYKNRNDYRLATQILSARYQVTDPAGPAFLRGYLELSGGLVGSAFVEGPESYFIGGVMGFRYNFVQRGARLSPYVEGRVGPGLTNARGIKYSQQQDFVFTYMIGLGLRYELTPRCSVTLGAIDQHLSNLYLADTNYGFDSIGVSAGLQLRY